VGLMILTCCARSKIFGSRDLTIVSLDLSSDGDSVYIRETLYENLGTPVKTCWISTGTPEKTCWNFLVVVMILSPVSSVSGTWGMK